jgi:hypothetical protein
MQFSSVILWIPKMFLALYEDRFISGCILRENFMTAETIRVGKFNILEDVCP